MAKVSVIGCGYVGLTVAVGMAHLGHDVVACDIDRERVRALQRGVAPMVEARMDEFLDAGLRSRRLRFVDRPDAAVSESTFHFVCVATPRGDDGSADLTMFDGAILDLAEVAAPGSVVVIKSTVPVGVADRARELLARSGRDGDDIEVVSCPEFLREGEAIHDFLQPDRLVIGADQAIAGERVAALFGSVTPDLQFMSNRSAEAVKYASNAFLAMKLSFINSMASLCEEVDADIDDVSRGVGSDARISSSFLKPGPGWGGSCFPKDVAALAHLAQRHGTPSSLFEATIETNEAQVGRIVEKVLRQIGPMEIDESGRRSATVGVWGLTFKAGTSDLRDSPALNVITRLIESGLDVQAFDPTVLDPVPSNLDIKICSDPYEASVDADVLVVLTEWDEFTEADLDKVAELMKRPCLVDARNILDRAALELAGISAIGVGR